MRKRVKAHGNVQGVFFRDTARRRAREVGVAGWVRNCSDGSVEAVFEGDEEAVGRMVQFMHEGPPGADVERVDEVDEDSEGLSSFEVRG